MAKLPTRDDLGGLPKVSARAATGAPKIPTVKAGAEFANLGSGIAKLGEAANAIYKHDQQVKAFETERAFQEFSWQQEQAAEEAARNIQPGQAAGFANNTIENYNKAATDFMTTVPGDLQPQVEAKLYDKERKIAGIAFNIERTERARFRKNAATDALANIYTAQARAARSEKELGEVSKNWVSFVKLTPEGDLPPIEMDELVKTGNKQLGAAYLNALPPTKALEVIRGRTRSIEDQIIGIESSGNPSAQSKSTSAGGLGGFIDSTWLRVVKRYRPDLAQGKTDAQIVALKTDPAMSELSREMTGHYVKENTETLAKSGLPVTPGNIYLAHFLGVGGSGKPGKGGAVEVLGADPNTPIENLVSPKAIEKNPEVLGGGKTAGDVVRWAAGKMGRPAPLAALSDDDWQKAETSANLRATQMSSAVKETFEHHIIEAKAGKTSLFDRGSVEQDPHLNPSHRNAVLEKYDAVAKDERIYADGIRRLGTPDAVWNPNSAADQNTLSVIDNRTGVVAGLGASSPEAATEAVWRFADIGMVSKDVKGTLEGMIRGGTAKQVGYAMSTLDAMYQANANAFARTFDEDTQKLLGKWQSSGNLEPKAFIEELKRANDPATIKARELAVKEARKTVLGGDGKSGMTDDELLSVFDGWFSDPAKPIGSRDAPGMAVYREQYAQLYAEGYAANNGDKVAAKRFADDRIKLNWSVSPSGGGRVMYYAPETLPEAVFPTVGGSRDWMKKQVEAALEDALSGGLPPDPILGSPLPTYGLVAMPYTILEIQAIKAGRKLPDGRESPEWLLVYADPQTGGFKQKRFYFNVADPRAEQDKYNADLEARNQRKKEREDNEPALKSSIAGAP